MLMASKRKRVGDAEDAIECALSLGRTKIEDVAQILFVSMSTLQRWVAPDTFTKVRQRVQLRLALKGLVSGRSVETVAQEVVLSRDHLRVLVKEATGLTPAVIVRAARMASRLKQWKAQVPPPAGTYAYRHRISEWDKTDRKLQAMLGNLGHENPLAPWAKNLLLSVARPDNRHRSNRKRIQDARRRESERLEALYRQEEQQFEEFFEESWAEDDLKPLSEATS